MSEIPVVAVDGPSGSGKGTLARELAQRLGWHYLDSGVLYRAAAWAALDRGVDPGDGPRAGALIRSLRMELGPDEVRIDGVNVTLAIRAEDVSAASSRIAAHPEVRAALIDAQRAERRAPGLVADGRDMGSVVFPDAKLKIFLEASPETRAERRYKQLKDKGLGVSLRALLAGIRERDERDRTRVASPLRPAPDAVVIDSTGLTIDAVLDRAWRLVCERSLN